MKTILENSIKLALYVCSMAFSFALSAEEQVISPDLIVTTLPATYKIENPVVVKMKRSEQFSQSEKRLDTYWFEQKKKLAALFVIKKKRELARVLAEELNNLTDDEFAFLSVQSYLWTDILGQEPRAFSASLSPSKLRIAADASANRDLKRLERNLISYIAKLVAYIELGDEDFLAKLEAFLPASVDSPIIESEVEKKARAYRQKMVVANNALKAKLADILIQKIEVAKKTRLERIMAIPLRPKEPEPPKEPERILKRGLEQVPKEEVPVEPPQKRPKIIESDANWRETMPEFAAWVQGDNFAVDNADLNKLTELREHLKFLLKQYPAENPEMQGRMKNAFIKTMAQYNTVNRLFDVITDTADENDVAIFMALLEGKAGEGKASDPYLIDLLWRVEKDLIISGKSVRELQAKRMAAMYRNLDDAQFEILLSNANFWVLLEDQPKASATGLKVHHIQRLAQYFMDNIKKDRFKPAGFANKVVPQMEESVEPDNVYASLLAIAPLAKFVPAIDSAIGFKTNTLGRSLRAAHGNAVGNEMMQKLRSALRR